MTEGGNAAGEAGDMHRYKNKAEMPQVKPEICADIKIRRRNVIG